MTRAKTNSQIARGVSASNPTAASWAVFDDMPRSIRRLLWESPVAINALSIQPLIDDGGEAYAARVIRGAVAGELVRFAAENPCCLGVAPLRYRDEVVTRARRRR